MRSCNPDRIVLKKAVLSGYPVKVNKKKAVVRWMFHNREDIQWFRPVDLWTKHGRRGQIKVCYICHAWYSCRDMLFARIAVSDCVSKGVGGFTCYGCRAGTCGHAWVHEVLV